MHLKLLRKSDAMKIVKWETIKRREYHKKLYKLQKEKRAKYAAEYYQKKGKFVQQARVEKNRKQCREHYQKNRSRRRGEIKIYQKKVRAKLIQERFEELNKRLIELVKKGLALERRKVWKQLKHDYEFRYYLKIA
jgi:hypothetical protein